MNVTKHFVTYKGYKYFELNNHLGNVLSTVSDRRIGVSGSNPLLIDYYAAVIMSSSDYYAFGMNMIGRSYSSASYRYGFNNKENDPEDGYQDYGMRQYNTRLGRFFSVDPITHKYPMLTPYQFASNRPIDGVDLDGLEYATFNIYVDKNYKVTKIVVTKDYELKDNNSKGAGIQYNIIDEKTGKRLTSDFRKNLYGIYQGGNNPQLPKVGEDFNARHDDYRLDPIDETDATAKQHDLDYDEKKLAGVGGILDEQSSRANKDYNRSADKIIDKYEKGELDNITKKPVTKEAAEAAKFGKKWFVRAESLKKEKRPQKIISSGVIR